MLTPFGAERMEGGDAVARPRACESRGGNQIVSFRGFVVLSQKITISRVTITAVKKEVMMPTPKVTAKPMIGPLPS